MDHQTASRRDGPPRSFFAVAAAVGAGFSTMNVSMPLLAIERGLSSTAVGLLFTAATLGIALSAAAASVVMGRLGSRNVLVAAIAVVGLGELVLMAPGETAALVAGALLVGAGIGLFWTASMAIMAASAGRKGSARVFVRHFVWFIVGNAAGSVAAGLVARAGDLAGLSRVDSLRASFAAGLVAVALAALIWRPGFVATTTAARPRLGDLPRLGLSLQAPSLLLVCGVSLVFPLVPLVLAQRNGFSALAVGAVVALSATARLAGTLLGGRLVLRYGSGPTAAGMLAVATAGATVGVLLGNVPLALVALVVTIYVGAIGAWPIGVDAALARMDPARRAAMSAAWNLREYAVVAASAAACGALYGLGGGATLPFVVAALAFGGATATAGVVLRRPVVVPMEQQLVPDLRTG